MDVDDAPAADPEEDAPKTPKKTKRKFNDDGSAVKEKVKKTKKAKIAPE